MEARYPSAPVWCGIPTSDAIAALGRLASASHRLSPQAFIVEAVDELRDLLGAERVAVFAPEPGGMDVVRAAEERPAPVLGTPGRGRRRRIPLGSRRRAILSVERLAGEPFSSAEVAAIDAVAGLLGASLDADDRTAAELDAMRHAFVTGNPATAMLVVDAQTLRCIEANDAAVASYGYSADELVGMSPSALRVDGAPSLLDFAVPGEHGAGGPIFSEHRRKDGTSFFVDERVFTLSWNGRPAFVVALTDVSDRVLAERGLRESLDRLTRIHRLVKVGHWYSSLPSGITYWSPELFEMTGLGRPDAPMTHIGGGVEVMRRFTHPDDRRRVVDELNAVIRDGTTRTIRYRWRTVGGETRWLEAIVARGDDADGTPARLVGTAADVTDRCRTELAFRETLTHLETAQRLTNVVHWHIEIETRRFAYLSAVLDTIAPAGTSTIDELVACAIHAGDRERFLAALDDCIAHGGMRRVEYRALLKDGGESWMESVFVREDDEAGKALRILGTRQNINHRVSTERALRESVCRMERAQRLVRMGHWTTDLATNRTTWSPEMFALTRLNRADAPDAWDAHTTVERFIAPEHRVPFLSACRAALTTGDPQRIVVRALRADGTSHWSEVLLSREVNDDGRPVQLVGTAMDITERVVREDALRDSMTKLQRIYTLTHVGHWSTDLATRLTTISDEIALMHGNDDPRREFPSCVDLLRATTHPDDFETTLAVMQHVTETGEPSRTEYRIVCPDGRVRWVEAAVAREDAPDGTPLRLVGTVRDVSDRKEAEERLAFHAHFDVLTGLANRAQLLERLSRSCIAGARDDTQFAVLFIDLDEFKGINDTLGHTAGDELLQNVAARLRTIVRENDLVARTGGDEFIIVLQDAEDRTAAARVARRVLDALRRPVMLGDRGFFVGASIGIACFPEDGRDPEALIRNADTAMYQAKGEGRDCFRFFTASMHEAAVERFHIETELREAIAAERLALHFQPIVELDGRIVGCEALVRWPHADGMRPPSAFIPVAEESGLIVELGRLVLRDACRQAAAWQDHGPLPVAVNVSARQLQRIDFVDDVRRALERSGLAPGLLEVELTETAFCRDQERIVRTCAELRTMGVRLSIDDFGTGYNSLANLRLCTVDTIKIDRSFVEDVVSSVSDRAIAAAVISAAHNLGARVIAEGIETEEQRAVLQGLGCDNAQGYLFSAALSPEAFAALLARGRA